MAETKSEEVNHQTAESCAAIHSTWNEFSRTWTLPTIHALGINEPVRFNQLKAQIKGISATSLAERLSQLEKFAVVQRTVVPESPPYAQYSLTAKGHEVYQILCDFAKWTERWAYKESATRASEIL